MNVKKFIETAKNVLRITSRIAELVGDAFVAFKVVDSIVDAFVEQRKKGNLKEADFLDYATAVCELVGTLAESSLPLVDIVEDITKLFDSSQKLASISERPHEAVNDIVKIVDLAVEPITDATLA